MLPALAFELGRSGTLAITLHDQHNDHGGTTMAERFRVTYATLSGDNEDLQAAYEQGLETASRGSAARCRPT